MPKRILIVDDAAIIRMKLRKVLTENGYTVAGECANGLQAVEKYKELRPDLVTLDIVMPEMDGLETLEQILLIDEAAKVIMITALDQRDSLMTSIRLGATDYIIKPFEDERVVSTVQKALESKG
ncbi:MAG: response regulator [Candidatus Omnitrophica bacterium]|nr:response regulator [Candidatus Omnitrophota bacterium]